MREWPWRVSSERVEIKAKRECGLREVGTRKIERRLRSKGVIIESGAREKRVKLGFCYV